MLMRNIQDTVDTRHMVNLLPRDQQSRRSELINR